MGQAANDEVFTGMLKNGRLWIHMFSLIGLLSWTAPAAAQVTTAALVGRVLDASGAVVAGATVVVTEVQTQVARTTTSDSVGAYEITNLLPGTYRVTTNQTGFKSDVRANVVLASGDRLRLDMTLAPGSINETVEVVVGTPLVNTQTSALGAVIRSNQVEALPLNGHNVLQLIPLTTGVVTSRFTTSFVINGNGQYGLNISLDGTDATAIEAPTFNEAGALFSLNVLSPDSLEQVEVKSGPFSAEYGRTGGGVINFVTKAGTNTVRGTAFEFFSDEALNARNFFATGKDPYSRHQFGGNFGAPIVKDRVFMFASYEGSRAAIGTQVVATNVPTAAFKARAPQVYANYLAAMPLPTESIPGNVDVGLYRRTDESQIDENLASLRLDYTRGRSSLFARYSLTNAESRQPSFLPDNPLTYPVDHHLTTLQHTYVLSSSTINEARFGANYFRMNRHNASFDSGLGNITVTGLLSNANTEGVLDRTNHTLAFSNTLTHNRGTHSIRIGGELRSLESGRVQYSNPAFSYTSIANFLANTPASVSVSYGHRGAAMGQYQFGVFLQDDWRVLPTLTLNLGLRYDYFQPLHATKGTFFTTGDDPFGAFLPGDSELYRPLVDNFQPRAGFAWDVSGHQTTVIRGGAGLYVYPVSPFFLWASASIDPLLPSSATYSPADVPSLAYPLSGALLAAYNDPYTAVQQGLAPRVVARTVVDPNRRDARVQQWSATLEQTLGSNMSVSASYVGSRTINALNTLALNLVNPATGQRADTSIGQINFSTSRGSRTYNALQLALRRRLSAGLTVNANYTYSRTSLCGGEDSFGPSMVQDWDNPEECGLSSQDLPHNFIADFAYALPSPTGAWRSVVGGWQLAGRWTLQSGYPFTILTGRDNRGNGLPATQRADYLGGSMYASDPSVTQWLNPSAFANPAAGQFGNMEYNAVRGPGYGALDLSLSKAVPLTGRQDLRFRVDAFNALNQVSLGTPVNNINNAAFGRVTSAFSSRQVQLSLRYTF